MISYQSKGVEMSISYSFKDMPVEELYGDLAIESSNDFSSMKELKQTIKDIFSEYACPNCGGHRVEGNKVIVEIGKIRMFKEVKKEGFFGSKYVDKHDRDVYRIYNIYLEPSGFLSFAGYIQCKSCKWEEKGAKGIKWLSVNDITKGRY